MRALFGYGFRPFFLLAGLQAMVGMAIWLAVLHGMPWPWPSPGSSLSPFAWHAHEMFFGFVAAALAGFLLTAVPSWTGQRGFAGAPLVVLAAVWLAGRVAMIPGLGSPPLAAAVDLAFLPAVALAVTPSLVRAGNVRNLPLVGFILLLFGANLLFHLPGLEDRLGVRAPLLAVDSILLLVVLVGGRVTPAFTGNALRAADPGARVAPFGWVDRLAMAAALAVLLVDLVSPGGRAAAAVAAGAAALLAWRLTRWRGWRVRQMPIAWILHVAYAWIPLGLGLKALWLLHGSAVASGWQHALTTGAFATMILAIMTRAALGHTGRPIVASPPIVTAYVLLTIAALVRVFGPAAMAPLGAWTVAGVLWVGAFAIYSVVYAPILLRPRADGRPG